MPRVTDWQASERVGRRMKNSDLRLCSRIGTFRREMVVTERENVRCFELFVIVGKGSDHQRRRKPLPNEMGYTPALDKAKHAAKDGHTKYGAGFLHQFSPSIYRSIQFKFPPSDVSLLPLI